MPEEMPAAQRCWFLVTAGLGQRFEAGDVYRWVPTDKASGSAVPLFSDEAMVEGMIAELAARGRVVEAAAVATGDELTTLLAALKKANVAHVALDPRAGNLNLIPIDVAVVRFQVGG